MKLILTGIVPILAGAILGVQGWQWKQKAAGFVENLREGEGQVIRITSGLDESLAELEYTDEAGVPYRKQFKIDPGQERDLRAIGKISLVYDFRDPRVAELGHVVSANNEMLLYWAVALVGLGGVAGGLAMFGLQSKKCAEIQGLFRNGQLVQTEVRDKALAPGGKVGCFTYAFRGPQGRWHEGRSPEMPAAQLAEWPVGRKVLVAYDTVNPLRSEADVFGVVEAKRRDTVQAS